MVDVTAQADLVNTALVALGKETIPDLSDASLASSIAARKVMTVIERARRTILRKHGWTCALTYTALYPSVIPNLPPSNRYPVTFLLPGDAVRVWEVEGIPANASCPPTPGGTYVAPPMSAWEPRWQVNTTEINGSTQLILRGAIGPGDGLFGDGVGYPSLWDNFPQQSVSPILDHLDPLVYVRLADWASLDDTVADLVAYEAAARAAYSVTANLALQGKLDQYVAKKLGEAVGADASQEGGQPEAMPSIPMVLRNFSR